MAQQKNKIKSQDKYYEMRLFDLIAKTGGFTLDPELMRFFNLQIKIAGLDLEGVILDCGCGTSGIVDHLAPRARVIGLDISPETCREANKRGQCVVLGDAEVRTNFQQFQFDCIFSVGFLHHFPKLNNVLSNIDYWLKPGGVFIIFEPDFDNIFFKITHTVRKLAELLGLTNYIVNKKLASPNEGAHAIHKYTDILANYRILRLTGFKSKRVVSGLYLITQRILLRLFPWTYEAYLLILKKRRRTDDFYSYRSSELNLSAGH